MLSFNKPFLIGSIIHSCCALDFNAALYQFSKNRKSAWSPLFPDHCHVRICVWLRPSPAAPNQFSLYLYPEQRLPDPGQVGLRSLPILLFLLQQKKQICLPILVYTVSLFLDRARRIAEVILERRREIAHVIIAYRKSDGKQGFPVFPRIGQQLMGLF